MILLRSNSLKYYRFYQGGGGEGGVGFIAGALNFLIPRVALSRVFRPVPFGRRSHTCCPVGPIPFRLVRLRSDVGFCCETRYP